MLLSFHGNFSCDAQRFSKDLEHVYLATKHVAQPEVRFHRDYVSLIDHDDDFGALKLGQQLVEIFSVKS